MTRGSAADGNDIKSWQKVRPGRARSNGCLTMSVSEPPSSSRLVSGRSRGRMRGRSYINEVGEFFAPIDNGDGTISYVHLGPLEDDPWFPAPDGPRA